VSTAKERLSKLKKVAIFVKKERDRHQDLLVKEDQHSRDRSYNSVARNKCNQILNFISRLEPGIWNFLNVTNTPKEPVKRKKIPRKRKSRPKEVPVSIESEEVLKEIVCGNP